MQPADRSKHPGRTTDVKALLRALTALAVIAVAACGGSDDERPASGRAGNSETTLIVRSIERQTERGAVVSEALRIVDPRTGASTTLPAREFVGGDAQFDVIYTGGQLVFRCSAGACVLDPKRRDSEPLGEAWCMAPSQTEGRVWLANLDPESPDTVRAMESVREVSVDGEVTVPASRLPPGRWHCPVGSVSSGVLFQEFQDQDSRLIVWDATAGEVVATLAEASFPAATHGDLIAWCPSRCGPELHITDVRLDREDVIRLEEPFVFGETYDGAFSPDGSTLAVPARREDERRDSRIALVDVERARASVLPSRLGTRSLVWSRDARELFAIAGAATLTAYDLRSGQARTIELEPPSALISLTGG